MATNLAELLSSAAADEPGRLALNEAATGRSTTWAELDDETSRVAAGLSGAGMVAGYRVMIAVANRIEFVTGYLGALRAQLVAVPVNPRSTIDELVRMLADSGARMVLADETTVDAVRAAIAALGETLVARADAVPRPRVVVVGVPARPDETSYADLVAVHATPAPARPDQETLAVLLYTSGTSGRPRAAMLSHRALLANIEQVAAVEPPMLTAQDVVFGVLPLFHVYGLNAVLGGVLRQRARLVLIDSFDAEGSLDIIEDEAVTVLPVAPPVVAYWMQVDSLEERFGPVRLVLSGSAPLSAELTEAFSARVGVAVHQGYGLTEAAPVVTSTLCSPDDDGIRPGSVGAALPGIELRLVDEAGRTPDADDGGEIQIRGDNLFSGYWPDGAGGPDADGWYATGDVGFLDADGQLSLVDRVRELVIVSGFNVYPSEVEDVVRELPEVAQAAVIGMDDEHTGEAVVVYVVARPDADPDAVEAAVHAHCGQRLARFKQPAVVHVVEHLPHTVTGKVQKGRLRAEERRRTLGLLER